MAGKRKCAACLKEINHRRFLICSKCTDSFDLECVNVSEPRFYNTMTADIKKSWICPQCKANLPKLDNTNTPVRQQPTNNNINVVNQTDNSSCNQNVTMRRKLAQAPALDDSSSLEETPPEGNTIILSESLNSERTEYNTLITEIRELKIQMTIQNEKQELLKNDLTSTIKDLLNGINNKYSMLEAELKSLKSSVHENTNEIEQLKKENTRLRQELNRNKESVNIENRSSTKKDNTTAENEIQNQPQQTLRTESEKMTLQSDRGIAEHNSRFLVIYGLNEYQNESEHDLYNRIIRAFYDIVNVNLTGYIEDLSRIGRKGYRRPLKVELLSKRMVKFLLTCKHMFKNTGLWISEYLDEKGLQDRNQRRLQYKQNNMSSNDTITHETTKKTPNHRPSIPQSQDQKTRNSNNHSFRRSQFNHPVTKY